MAATWWSDVRAHRFASFGFLLAHVHRYSCPRYDIITRHRRPVPASKSHVTEITPRPDAIVPLASASSHRPALMVISFPSGAQASMNHVHPLLPAVCINLVNRAGNPVNAQARLRSIAIDELRFEGRDHKNHTSCLGLGRGSAWLSATAAARQRDTNSDRLSGSSVP